MPSKACVTTRRRGVSQVKINASPREMIRASMILPKSFSAPSIFDRINRIHKIMAEKCGNALAFCEDAGVFCADGSAFYEDARAF